MMPRPQSMKVSAPRQEGFQRVAVGDLYGLMSRPGPDTAIISTVPLASATEACMRQAARAATTTSRSPVLSLIVPPHLPPVF